MRPNPLPMASIKTSQPRRQYHNGTLTAAGRPHNSANTTATDLYPHLVLYEQFVLERVDFRLQSDHI